ncbi:ESX secretion-associated protein EspG [Umezawaea tangerina]|uniref:ESAT-6 protein secretion system EspG family protein n=1 Tax=Umezawaea tangerina TaxID=84725 RepID=A0A2T0TLL5_9PSEU|nr:ESX secretion-associated protein EspG [Umezawaea tangerina]PRY46537.1 ESAT-6 protein secretion system EspG family protein [Umezawaea tangerina]
MIAPDFLLSPAEFDILWHELELGGRPPYPLDVPSIGTTMEERARLRLDVLEALGRRGLANDARLQDMLRLLAEHEIAVDAVAHMERPVRAVVASDGGNAVLAVVDEDQIGLVEVRPTSLAKSIVGVLNDGQAGPGSALSLRLETLVHAVALHEDPPENDDPWGDEDLDEKQALQRAGVSGPDAAVISELAENRVAGGQFGVSRRGGSRYNVQRAEVTINWFDTPQGRYLMVRENGWLSLSPTDNERIANRIDSVLAAV